MANTIEVEGLVGGEPELRYTPEGTAIATFNIADTPRKYNKETRKWENDGDTVWYRVTVFGNQAEQIKANLNKGTPVFVKGNLSFHAWETKTGEKRENKEIRADKVYVSVRNTTTASSSDWSTSASFEDSPF